MTTVISWCFMLYFVILLLERVQSIIKISADGILTSVFNSYASIVVAMSLVATAILLAIKCKGFWESLFNNAAKPDYLWLSVTAGVMLISGMVHTAHTVAPVQFAAYGALIAGMILRTVQTTKGTGNTLSWWFSLAFVVALSMAIPVVYSTGIKQATLFYVIEAVVTLALIVSFTMLLINIMTGNGANLLWWIPAIIVLLGDTLVIALRWRERINFFVMFFAIITIALFAIGKLLFANRNGIVMK